MSTRHLKFCSLAVLGLISAGASAQSSVVVPVELVWISNPTLTPGGRGSVTLLRSSPQYTLEKVDGGIRTEFSLGATVEQSSNTGLSANRADPNIRFLWETSSALSVLQLTASVQEASTRETQFTEFGRNVVDGTQRTGTLGARWNRQLGPSSALELGGTHARVTFDTPAFIDYDETRANAVYRLEAGPNTRYTLDGNVARLNADGAASAASRIGLGIGIEHDLSPAWRVQAGLGVVRVDEPRRDSIGVASVRFSYTGERLTGSIGLSREVSPTGTSGRYVRSQAADASLAYNLTESTVVSAGVGRTRSLETAQDVGVTTFVRTRTSLSRAWALTFGLEARRSQPGAGLAARSHGASVGLVYEYPGL